MEFGLIGEHLSHSFSKEIHESIAGYSYELVEISKDNLDSFMREKNFKAINVTIPYKEKVIPYIDEISIEAKNVGAVNTIVNRNGKLYGYNTDVFGFIEQLKQEKIDVKDKVVLILGSGGASKAVKVALTTLGAKEIFVASRNKKDDFISYNEIYDHQEIDIIVNTTPLGMYPHEKDELLIVLDKLKSLEAVVDVIYNPLRTRLLIEAEKRKLKTSNGLYMLVGQAYHAIEIFLDKKLNLELLDEAYQKIKNKKSNIVLIGMPSSGKSTIAKELSKKLDTKMIDTDEEIIKRIKMDIKDFFAKYGEEEFRKIESEVVNDIYQETPLIISTGGGIIKNRSNIVLLKHNGTIIFIDRDLDKLTPSSDRPLSNNNKDLENLYYERRPIYIDSADKIVKNNDDVSDAINEILGEIR